MSVAPIRTARQNPVLATVAIIIVLLGCVTVILLINQSTAVHALRTSSSRGECRTRVTNDAEDVNRHDNAQLFVYVSDLIRQSNDNERVAAAATLSDLHDLAAAMKNRPSVQSTIDKVCPKPLVTPTSGT